MTEYDYVDNQKGLREMQSHVGRSSRISVDLESDSYHHYREKVCLVQIATDTRVFVYDPLALDLSHLAPLLSDGSKEKVFHDVDFDGRMILTSLGVKPQPVFDTMIASRVLGKARVGLADLLKEYFGVSMDKGLQKADWSRRPLSEEMLGYAALDVAYLLPLRDRMAEEIEKMDRMSWAAEEFARLVDSLEPMPEKKVSFMRVRGARELSPRQLAVLQKLLDWRERRASGMDLPSFKIVGTERLLTLARRAPRSRRELERSGILSKRQLARFGGEMLKAVELGIAVPSAKLPGFPRQDQRKRDYAAERILRCFKKVRDRRARELGLDPGFLMPNATLKAVARARPRNVGDIYESGLLKDWQLGVMAESLAQCL